MKSKNTILKAVGGVFAAIGLVGSGLVQAETVIRINHANAEDLGTDQQMFAWVFANYINENSDSLRARIFPNGGLGESREVLEAMQFGAGASVHIGGAAELANFSREVGVLGLPFIWEDYDHVHEVLDGEVGEILAEGLEAQGFKVLAWGDSWGYRNVITSSQEISDPSDLDGLKIRTIPTDVFVAAVNLMGASPTPMSFGEVYTALESGVLDGFEHTAATVVTSQFNEVTCCLAQTKHLFDPTALTYSLQEWQRLSEGEQRIVLEAAELASDIVRQLAPLREEQSMERLEDLGMSITEIDTSDFRERAIAEQDRLAEQIGGTELLSLIRNRD